MSETTRDPLCTCGTGLDCPIAQSLWSTYQWTNLLWRSGSANLEDVQLARQDYDRHVHFQKSPEIEGFPSTKPEGRS